VKFFHTLSVPEHIWVDFFRVFFSQRYLLKDDLGNVVENRFRYDESVLPDNRPFDILFESDLTGANPNILPALVIEDSGTAQSGILLNQLKTWSVAPNVMRDRQDLLRSTYVFHCCSRTRGESRLLASIVGSAITAFRDALLEAGLHKIDPWSIGKSQPLKADADEVYVDTPVIVNFSYQEGWRTEERYDHHFECYKLNINPDQLNRFVRTAMTLADVSVSRFMNTSMFLENVNTESFILSSLAVADPNFAETFVNATMTPTDPLSQERFLRASMRVS
jgi:hypothetical protein